MSKGTVGRKHVEKMKKRRAKKAAKAAKYAALKGTSKKGKNQGGKSKLSTNAKHSHLMIDCGNVGCKRCHPI